MAIAKLTIVGINNYKSDLWDLMQLPEGLEKDVLVDTILSMCGEFPLIHPDADYMKNMIGSWSRRWKRSFERWLLASNVDYNPLYNVDAQIEIIDTREDHSTGNSNAINQVSAFDSSEFQNKDKLEGSSKADTESKNIHTEDRHGNIGVTKSTELVAAEVQLRRWNVYNEIATCFCNEFCIPVYD